MTVLDAYAVIAYLRGETAATEVAALLRSRCLLSAINAAETMDQLVRIDGADPDEVEVRLEMLQADNLVIQEAGPEVAIRAGALRAKHDRKGKREVSLADCFAAATAIEQRLPLATADPALLDLLRGEGAETHRLTNRR